MPAINFNFISSNVKEFKLTKKRINLFSIKNGSQGCCLCSRNSLNRGNRTKMERSIEWANIFFLHDKSNSCGIFIAFLVVNQ